VGPSFPQITVPYCKGQLMGARVPVYVYVYMPSKLSLPRQGS